MGGGGGGGVVVIIRRVLFVMSELYLFQRQGTAYVMLTKSQIEKGVGGGGGGGGCDYQKGLVCFERAVPVSKTRYSICNVDKKSAYFPGHKINIKQPTCEMIEFF